MRIVIDIPNSREQVEQVPPRKSRCEYPRGFGRRSFCQLIPGFDGDVRSHPIDGLDANFLIAAPFV